MKLVFATNNQHKLDEVQKITAGHTEIVSLAAIDCHDDIPETADTLEGNALQKARYINDKFGYDCFADDTGLEVEALNNAPGVYSARYAGPAKDSVENMKKVLREMEGISDRKACFRTVIALIQGKEEQLLEIYLREEDPADNYLIQRAGRYPALFDPGAGTSYRYHPAERDA